MSRINLTKNARRRRIARRRPVSSLIGGDAMDQSRGRPLVVVVDDDDDLAELMATVLEDEGYAVEVRRQWEAAVELVGRVQPDLVILDVAFGREPMGWCVLERLKAKIGRASCRERA